MLLQVLDLPEERTHHDMSMHIIKQSSQYEISDFVWCHSSHALPTKLQFSSAWDQLTVCTVGN